MRTVITIFSAPAREPGAVATAVANKAVATNGRQFVDRDWVFIGKPDPKRTVLPRVARGMARACVSSWAAHVGQPLSVD